MKRSYLFVPGNRPERFAKALASGAGAVILDLEDAVPPEAKAGARNAVCDWLRQHENAAWVRINGHDTEFFEDDLRALAGAAVPGVMLPKAEAPLELGMPVIPLIESAAGLWNALQVARGPCVERLAFGSVDWRRTWRAPAISASARSCASIPTRSRPWSAASRPPRRSGAGHRRW